ncbi:D-2-hydroxyacid dehydrogenase [Flavilitoribacter nigricans]|uniref:Glycerate dehydrogenase n=1 Tax=Flavilitoribacter nigricans (strain ATCC 23147 / DSM 23189 / NBRC 102662 / NCIMB 1420 / SS-2) TaxID=1122177 RepID=A0A2D0NFD8_FLAN2|nr:D-2-hydroxyacid dehydrogenase [Flavilitoribacter nigricans]PHN07128.1 glycerate dehydrogenase [Flavilitoribacter nigricans DSM 23189 = NBRC 102662]
MEKPNIVVLDGYTLNPGDLSWEKLEALGRLTVYDRSKPEEVIPRAKNAQILLANKQKLSRETLSGLPELRCISVTATGYNNIDTEAAKELGITVCNVSGYGTTAVAQHVFALMLHFLNQVAAHHEDVLAGGWSAKEDFAYTLSPITELAGKTLGIYGFGQIGQHVGKLGHAFGMKVISKHKHPKRDARPWVRFVDLDELFEESDFLTLHAPLTEDNAGLINRERLQQMKATAYLINTGRGGLINEPDLKAALEDRVIAGAGLDVLSQEPPPADHLLFGVKNCVITPHNAWASREARQRLMNESANNIRSFLAGEPVNVVVEGNR